MASVTMLFADWNSSTTGYAVWSFDADTITFTVWLTGPGSNTISGLTSGGCDFGSLLPGSTYTCHLTPTNAGGVNGSTATSSFTTPSPAPLPSNVTGIASSTSYPPPTVYLTWNVAANATSYSIHYGRTDGTYDAITTSSVNSATITDIIQGKNYYFYVYGENGTGQSPSASTVIYNVAGPGRPTDFAWTYTTVSAGQPCGMDHRDWNNLTAKINDFRSYYSTVTLSPYSFTTAPVGVFEAFYYRQAVNAINDMSPTLSVPPLHYTGDTVIGSQIDLLRLSLNSIP